MNGAVAGNLAMRGRASGRGALRDAAIKGRLSNLSIRAELWCYGGHCDTMHIGFTK